MSKSVNAANVEHALSVRAAIRNAVGARWPELSADRAQRNTVISDAVSIYNAQMIARAVRKGAESVTETSGPDELAAFSFL